MTWRTGPREWSPRIEKGRRVLDLIVSEIPPELIMDLGTVTNVKINGCFFDFDPSVTTFTHRTVPGVSWKIVLLTVPLPPKKEPGIAFLGSNGQVAVEGKIIDLLRRKLPGFEHLVERWPWGKPQ